MSDMGKVKDMELEPVSDKAEFTSVVTKEYSESCRMEMIIEEDLLVPDTEPDMEQIFNISAEVTDSSLRHEKAGGAVNGELKVQVLYRSTDGKLLLLENRLPFEKEWTEKFSGGTEIRVKCEARAADCHIINERKYRVRVRIEADVREAAVKERQFFEGIRGRELELRKEKTGMLSLAGAVSKENEIDEELKINNEKIRPVKIIKSCFSVCENHRQLTSDKLVVNTTVWVRIVYMAELASQGNVANYPMYFTGKIDSTQFIPTVGGREADGCRINYDAAGLTAVISDASDGFRIKGFLKTEADIFEILQHEAVTDFYDMTDEMMCDRKKEQVCCGLETVTVQHTVKDTVDLRDEHWDTGKIVYTDARIMEYDIEMRESRAEICGRMQMEALVLGDEGRAVTARKICEFVMPLNSADDGKFECCGIVAREITADLAGSYVNITVQLQASAELCRYSDIDIISNPCIVRGERQTKYPLTVCTVKDGESVWDIAKRYRVPAEHVRGINGVDELMPGMKIIVAR